MTKAQTRTTRARAVKTPATTSVDAAPAAATAATAAAPASPPLPGAVETLPMADLALSEENVERHAALSEEAEAGGDLTPEEAAELAALEEAAEGRFTPEQKAHAGVVLTVNPRGELGTAAGLVRAEDRAAAIAAGVLLKPTEPPQREDVPAAPRSPFSAAVAADLAAIRLAAVQTALLAKPDLALDLLAFGLSEESGDVPVLGLRPEPTLNRPSVAEGFRADERLHRPERAWHERRRPSAAETAETAEAFAAFRRRPEAERLAALAAGLAPTLPHGPLLDTVATLAGADPRSVWTPGEANLLRRMRSDWLDGLLAELLDLDASDERLAGFRRRRKSEKVAVLRQLFEGHAETVAIWSVTPAQRARIDAWLPAPMRTPEPKSEADAEPEVVASAEETGHAEAEPQAEGAAPVVAG